MLPNNVMPANAAAWYMAKRKYYLKEPLEQQLLSLLLKKFPEKFRLSGKKVFVMMIGRVLIVLRLFFRSGHLPGSV